MEAIDTNILVRLLVKDDAAQYEAAYSLFQRSDIYIPDTIILEAEWVLRFAYDFSAKDICSAFRGIFGLKNVVVDEPRMITKALDWYESGLDFADALHLAKSEQHACLRTFDQRFVKRSKGLSACKVALP